MNITSIGNGPTLESLASSMLEMQAVEFRVHLHSFSVVVTSVVRESEQDNRFFFRGTCTQNNTQNAPKQSITGWARPGSQIYNVQIKEIESEHSRQCA